MSTRIPISIVTFVLATALTDVARGAFIAPSPLPSGWDGERAFDRQFGWIWNEESIRQDGANWRTVLSDDSHDIGRDLTVHIQHAGGPNFTFNFCVLELELALLKKTVHKMQVKQAGHDGARDVTYASLAVDYKTLSSPTTTLNAVGCGGRHSNNFSFAYSLVNTTGGTLTDITVTPSYRYLKDGLLREFEGTTIAREDLAPGQRDSHELPATAKLPYYEITGQLADYTVSASGSNRTQTTLAFLGEIDGVLTELDLGLGTSLLGDDGAFEVPMLRSDTEDLFVAVDLSQWLNPLNRMEFQSGSMYTLLDGKTDLLPGFQVATSPFEFVAGTGFVAANLYTGGAVAVATIDGHSIPEPSSFLVFMSFGALALLARRQLGNTVRDS